MNRKEITDTLLRTASYNWFPQENQRKFEELKNMKNKLIIGILNIQGKVKTYDGKSNSREIKKNGMKR